MEWSLTSSSSPPSEDEDPFLDGPVICMTKRVRRADRSDRPDSYYGPWKAVYEPLGSDGSVRKHVVRGETDPDVATVDCLNAQVAVEAQSPDSQQVVKDTFGSLSQQNVSVGTNEVTGQVENGLANLGYLR
jgi:hypothetical protein